MGVFILVGMFMLMGMFMLVGMFVLVRIFMPVCIRNRMSVYICMLRTLRSLFHIHLLFTGQIRFHLHWNSFIISVYLPAHSLGVVSAVRHAQQAELRSFRLTSDCTLSVLYHPIKSETIFPHQTIFDSQTVS